MVVSEEGVPLIAAAIKKVLQPNGPTELCPVPALVRAHRLIAFPVEGALVHLTART